MKFTTTIFILLISLCAKQDNLVNVKDSLLYKDRNGKLYLKHITYIMRENEPSKAEIRYFDSAVFNSKVVELRNFVEVQTFRYNGKDASNRVHPKDIYTDKKYIYYFDDFPARSPQIEIFIKKK